MIHIIRKNVHCNIFRTFCNEKVHPAVITTTRVDSFTSYYLPLTIHDSACEPGTRSWHLPPSTGCRWSWGTPGWSATWYPRRWRFLPTTGPRTRLGTFYSQAGNILFPRWEQHKIIRDEFCAIRVGYWTIRVGYWTIRAGYWTIRAGYWTIRAGYWRIRDAYR